MTDPDDESRGRATRRTVLGAGIAGLAALAGCSGDGGDGTATPAPTDAPTRTPTRTATRTPTETATETTWTTRPPTAVPASLPEDTAVWMHPTPFSDVFADLGGDLDAWDWVREHVDGVEWHGTMNVVHQAGDDGEAFLGALADADSGIAMEIGGPDYRWKPFDEGLGERAAAAYEPILQGVEDTGGYVDHVNVDGPVKRMLEGIEWGDSDAGLDSVERVAEELVDFVAALRESFPGVTPWLITNFPNWGWKGEASPRGWGDYYDAFATVAAAFGERGVPLEGVMVDHPLEYGNKDRLFDLRDEAHVRDLGFNMIVNTTKGGRSSDALFAKRTLAYFAYLQEEGLDPDRYTVESWYPHPKRNVPESDPTTMTGLTRRLLETRDGPPETTTGG